MKNLLYLLAISMLSSCASLSLSHEEASAIIKSSLKKTYTSDFFIYKEEYRIPRSTRKGYSTGYMYLGRDVRSGFLESGIYEQVSQNGKYRTYRLTDYGRSFLAPGTQYNGTYKTSVELKTGDYSISISGISMNEEDNSATVQYLKVFEPTKIGHMIGMKRKEQTKSTVLTKFDTGWRPRSSIR